MARIILSGHDRPVPYHYDELTSGERLRGKGKGRSSAARKAALVYPKRTESILF